MNAIQTICLISHRITQLPWLGSIANTRHFFGPFITGPSQGITGCPFFIINTYSSIWKVLLPFYPHSIEPGMKHLVYKIYKVEILHLSTQELPKQQNKFWLDRLRGHLSSQLIHTSMKRKLREQQKSEIHSKRGIQQAIAGLNMEGDTRWKI